MKVLWEFSMSMLLILGRANDSPYDSSSKSYVQCAYYIYLAVMHVLFIVTFNLVEHPQNKLVPFINYIKADPNNLSLPKAQVNKRNMQLVMFPRNHKTQNSILHNMSSRRKNLQRFRCLLQTADTAVSSQY